MANYEALTSAIQQAIKTNGNQEITGQVLQTVLLQMVNTLGTGAQFMGEATLTTDPGNPDASVFYIASIKGTYTHFGNLTLNTDEVAALSNATGAWTKTTLFYLQSGAPGWDTSKDPTAPLLATIKAGFGALGAYFWDNFISNSPLKTISSGKLGIASGLSDGNITIYLASNIPVAVTATYAYRSGGNNVVVTIPANGTVKMQISGTSAGSSDNLTFSFDYDIEEDHRCIGAVAVIESSDGGGGQQAPLIISLDNILSMPSGVGDTKNFPGTYIGCSVSDIIAAVNAGTPVAAKRGTQYYNLSITDTASSKVVAEILLRKSSGTGLFFTKMELTEYATSPNSANVVLTGEVEVGSTVLLNLTGVTPPESVGQSVDADNIAIGVSASDLIIAVSKGYPIAIKFKGVCYAVYATPQSSGAMVVFWHADIESVYMYRATITTGAEGTGTVNMTLIYKLSQT